MNTDRRDVVTLGADVGGKDAYAATNQHALELRRLLRQECLGPYSVTINEFALVLRIDGSVQSWGKSGVDNVALERKKDYVTADIFIPKEVWATDNVHELRRFIGEEAKAGIIKMADCAKNNNIEIALGDLRRDFDRALRKYYSLN